MVACICNTICTWEAEAGELHLDNRVRLCLKKKNFFFLSMVPGQHGETPISTKNIKISRAWWCAPVIPVTQEAKAGELLEPGGRGCSEPRLSHHTPAQATEQDPISKKKKRKKRKYSLQVMKNRSPSEQNIFSVMWLFGGENLYKDIAGEKLEGDWYNEKTEFYSCNPGWSEMAQSQLTATSASWVQELQHQGAYQQFHTQAPAHDEAVSQRVTYSYKPVISHDCQQDIIGPAHEDKEEHLGATSGAGHHARLIFAFLVEMGFHHVGQAGLELLNSGDLPASASQSAGITGACHHTQLIFVFLVEMGFYHVGQAGLELLNSSDPPALASQSAGVSGLLEFETCLDNTVRSHLYIKLKKIAGPRGMCLWSQLFWRLRQGDLLSPGARGCREPCLCQ
ncbi:Zinc finger protein [Plecturocebus cupreus]